MQWWLAVDFDRVHGSCDAVWVQAEDADEAADEALGRLQEVRDYAGSDEPVANVFVLDGSERIAFEVASITRRAEHQCCGGIEGGRHSALCTEAPESARGLFGIDPQPDPMGSNVGSKDAV